MEALKPIIQKYDHFVERGGGNFVFINAVIDGETVDHVLVNFVTGIMEANGTKTNICVNKV